MRPADLLRRTSFRLAIGFAALIFAVLAVAGVLGYGIMTRELVARQDARILETVTALRQVIAGADQPDVIEGVQTRIDASADFSSVYLLAAADGTVLAANMPDIWTRPGWSDVTAAQLGLFSDDRYRLLTETRDDYRLVVGRSDAESHEVINVIGRAFAWAAALALAAVLAMATIIGTSVQRRMAVFESTLNRVAAGDFAARLPITRRQDDLDRISTAINGAVARLAAQVEAVRQVSSDIAHDLRTPLNRLRIRIETALQNNRQDSIVAAELEGALAETDRIAETFAALLRIAQIEAGARRAAFHDVDLSQVAADVCEAYAAVATDAGMTLSCDAAPLAMLAGDRDLLTQACANLIENAIRHCPPGTIITCSVARRDAMIRLHVRDNGPGIPEAHRGNVLRRLFRLEQSRTTEGNGLGLALVKAVADLHDATLVLTDAKPGLRVEMIFRAG